MVKQKVVIGVFEHAESKSGLCFVLTLLLYRVLATFRSKRMTFLPFFRKTTRSLVKLGSKIFRNIPSGHHCSAQNTIKYHQAENCILMKLILSSLWFRHLEAFLYCYSSYTKWSNFAQDNRIQHISNILIHIAIEEPYPVCFILFLSNKIFPYLSKRM